MPNFAALLKQEFVRLSRKESRSEVRAVRKASTQHRREIAALKRDLQALKGQVGRLQRELLRRSPAAPAAAAAVKIRFVPKGLRSERTRLGLSAERYGRLVGVSAQSVYNWEQGHAVPRAEQRAAIHALRGVRKSVVKARLAQLDAAAAKKPRKKR